MNTATHIMKLKKSISWYKRQSPDKIPDPGFQISKGFKVQYPKSRIQEKQYSPQGTQGYAGEDQEPES
jgi:hypothetical protein